MTKLLYQKQYLLAHRFLSVLCRFLEKDAEYLSFWVVFNPSDALLNLPSSVEPRMDVSCQLLIFDSLIYKFCKALTILCIGFTLSLEKTAEFFMNFSQGVYANHRWFIINKVKWNPLAIAASVITHVLHCTFLIYYYEMKKLKKNTKVSWFTFSGGKRRYWSVPICLKLCIQ